MALGRSRQEPARRPRVVTAAAAKVNLDDRKEVRRVLDRRREWQDDAWAYFDAVGELKFAAYFLSDAISKVRIFPAERPENPDDAPVATEDPRVLEAFRRLRAPSGGLQEIQRELALHLTVPGEGYLVGLMARDEEGAVIQDNRPLTATDQDERWFVVSTEEIQEKAGVPVVTEPSTGDEIKLTPADFWARIWRRHPRKGQEADSSFRGVLDAAEELLIIQRAIRAMARSRLPAGILTIPEEFDPPGAGEPHGDEGGDEPSEFERELMTAMGTAVQDEADASALMPFILRGKASLLGSDMVRHLTFDRPVDEVLIERSEAALRRIAQGINLPVEFIFGLGEANHWGAGQIEESAFRMHIEPLLLLILDGLTQAFLRPELRALGVEQPERFTLWHDPSQLVTDRRRREQALQAKEAGLIGERTAVQTLGWSPDDLPTANEVERELLERIATAAGDPSQIARIRELVEADRAEQQEGMGVEGNGLRTAPMRPRPPVTAQAGNGAEPTDLGRRLAEIDRALRERLAGAADAAMRRALERAGNRLANRSRKDRELSASLRDVPADRVASHIGPGRVAALATPDELFEGAWDDLGDRFERWVEAAARRSVDLLPDVTEEEREEALSELARARSDAWRWFSTALTELAGERLRDPEPEPEPEGEVGPATTVPTDLVREALSRAGGADGTTASLRDRLSAAARAVGSATGAIVMRLAAEKGVTQQGWEWDYGPAIRERPFLPHEELDGVQFTSWEDSAISNFEGFPPVSFFRPGDHAGSVVGSTPISGAEPRATSARWYSGEVVDLRTEDGRELTLTPNHPVLTDRGWLPAAEVAAGARVIVTARTRGEPISSAFERMWADPSRPAACVLVAAGHFHGDGRGSDAALVAASPDAVLWPEIPWSDVDAGVRAETARGLAERLEEAEGPLEGLIDGGAVRPWVERSGGKRDACLRDQDTGRVLRVPLGTWYDPPMSPAPRQLRESGSLRDLAGLRASRVASSQTRPFAGHVYDAHTDESWYAAGGIVVHNCLCDAVPVLVRSR